MFNPPYKNDFNIEMHFKILITLISRPERILAGWHALTLLYNFLSVASRAKTRRS